MRRLFTAQKNHLHKLLVVCLYPPDVQVTLKYHDEDLRGAEEARGTSGLGQVVSTHFPFVRRELQSFWRISETSDRWQHDPARTIYRLMQHHGYFYLIIRILTFPYF